MKNYKELIAKKWFFVVFAIIMAGGIFVRTYEFSDWLYFRADQVRDAKIIKGAFEEGVGALPLLGPRAAGTFLRLGPAFYYFEYLSAKTFNSVDPWVFAYPDLFFSICTIPLFYYFLRRFFSKGISLAVIAIYTFSCIIVQYSRFAWNPNQVPFWGLLFVLSLYSASTETRAKIAGRWLLLAGLSYGIVSQLHFVALAGFPVIAIIFWLGYFPKRVSWKYWVGSIATILLLYVPVFLSDWKTGGDNLSQFIYALTAKTSDGGKEVVDSLSKIVDSYFMFLTSWGGKETFISVAGGITLVLLGIAAAFWFWKKRKDARPFIYLIMIWFIVFTVLQIKANSSLKPRFFLPVAAIPFVFWGFICQLVVSLGNRAAKILIFALSMVFVVINLNGLVMCYRLYEHQISPNTARRPIFIQQKDGKTLSRMAIATEYMAEGAGFDNGRICFYAAPDHRRSYEYLFSIKYPKIEYKRIAHGLDNKGNCTYFSLATAKNGAAPIGKKFKEDFVFAEMRSFGNIAVWDAKPTEKFLSYQEEEQAVSPEEEEGFSEEEMEVFEGEGFDEQELREPSRKDRIFWRDIL